MFKNSRIWKSVAALSIAGLALTACGDDGGNGGNDEAGGNGDGGGDGNGGGEITLAVFNGWAEGIAVSNLWKHILEEDGYTVNLEQADPAPVFSGLSTGDYDFTMDVWEPITHASYLEEYGDDLEELGTWNENSKLTIAVNEDAPIESLDELAENADAFGNTLVGIDPGAGLTETTEDEVIPTYGLEDMEYITSSTPSMLQELDTSINNEEDVVVTLWEPHWAYEAYPIRNLEDPEGALGEAETMSSYSRTGFSEEFPQVAEWISNFEMETDTLHTLEEAMFNTDEEIDDYQPVVEEWVSENQDYVDGLTN